MSPKLPTLTIDGLLALEFGNATGTIDGIFYAPGANLYLHDSGGGSSGLNLITDLLVKTLDDQTASLNITSYSQSTAGSSVTGTGLSPFARPLAGIVQMSRCPVP